MATLHPDASYGGSGRLVPQWEFDFQLGDAIRNVLLFVPLGVGLALRGVTQLRTLAIAAAISITVETLQLAIPGRAGSPVDVGTNSVGALVGGWLVWGANGWLTPPADRTARLVGCAGIAVAALFVTTARLFVPVWDTAAEVAIFAPEFANRESYSGRILSVDAAEISLADGSPESVDAIRAAVAGDFVMTIALVAGTPPARPAPILLMRDTLGRHVFEVAADGEDLVHQFKTRGKALGLEGARLRISGALEGVGPGDVVSLRVERRGSDYCASLDATPRCGHGFTVGDGWLLISPSLRIALGALRPSLGLLWVGAWFVPLGLWGGANRASALGVSLALASLVLAPCVGALIPTPWPQIAAAFAGLATGRTLRTLAADRTPGSPLDAPPPA